MLTQLRTAVSIAKAIQADVDRITKRTKPYRAYTFFDGAYGLRMIVASDMGCFRTVNLAPREYARFVAVANTGNYVITIEDSDFGVAWTLRRKSA